MDPKQTTSGQGKSVTSDPECFVIMPIGECEGYLPAHFLRVYRDIITPACKMAGYEPVRGDDVKQTNLIHLDILQKLLNSPMAICDLSSRNPNVLFELALRQAFDKPVVLVQEIGTKAIFDISPLRYTEYRKERLYHEVLEDQQSICRAIKDTVEAYREKKGINSIVKLLALSQPASLPETNAASKEKDLQQVLLSEIGQLRVEFRQALKSVSAMKTRAYEKDPPEFRAAIERLLGEYMRLELELKLSADMDMLDDNIISRHKDFRSRVESAVSSLSSGSPQTREDFLALELLTRIDKNIHEAYKQMIKSREEVAAKK